MTLTTWLEAQGCYAVEATEFPELSRAYGVSAVPKIVINDRVEFEGALPEAQFLEAVLRAASASAAD